MASTCIGIGGSIGASVGAQGMDYCLIIDGLVKF